MVWTAVTSSERLFASACILLALNPRSDNYERHRLVDLWHEFNRTIGPSHRQLLQIVDGYIEQRSQP
jgi:hypothetical protein